MLLDIDEHVHVVALIGNINRFINSLSTKQLTQEIDKTSGQNKKQPLIGM